MDKKIIDGKLVSEKIRGQIKDHVDELKNQTSAVPGLAAVLAVSYTHLTLPTITQV